VNAKPPSILAQESLTIAGDQGGEHQLRSKVLLVEDSPTQALRARLALESQGFHVLIVDRSRDAIAVAKEEHPDVVLSEVQLLGLDGFELAAAVRSDSELAGLPVILQSAVRDEQESLELALEHGAAGFIAKGVSPAALAGALSDAIANARS
jgi:CheY-like chemotaxis protein